MFRPKAWIKLVGKKIRVFGLSKILFFIVKKVYFSRGKSLSTISSLVFTKST